MSITPTPPLLFAGLFLRFMVQILPPGSGSDRVGRGSPSVRFTIPISGGKEDLGKDGVDMKDRSSTYFLTFIEEVRKCYSPRI